MLPHVAMKPWIAPRYRPPWPGAPQRHWAVSPPRTLRNARALRRIAPSRPRLESATAQIEDYAGGRSEKIQALEAVLLLAREPLSSRKLSQYANLADGTEALTLIRQLNRLYDQERRAFRVEEVAGGFQLMTRPFFADWLRRLAGTPDEVRLSVPAMETLAVVSYRQPVLRAEIEAIRGVACEEILRQLMERDLVRIQGRSDELGRPFLYGTTTRFLHVFGLASLDDLPRTEILRRFAADGPGGAGVLSIHTHSDEGEPAVEMGANAMVMEAEELMEMGSHELASSMVRPPERAFDDEEEAEDEVEDDDVDEDDDDEEEDEDDDFDDEFDDDYEDDGEEEWEDDEELDDEDESEWEEVDDEEEWEDEDDEEEDDEDDDWDLDDDE